jgi:hypothetical protein
VVRVTAKPGASQRTKNRVNEFGPDFNMGREAPSLTVLGGARARLVSTPDGRWVGWLPADEIEVE